MFIFKWIVQLLLSLSVTMCILHSQIKGWLECSLPFPLAAQHEPAQKKLLCLCVCIPAEWLVAQNIRMYVSASELQDNGYTHFLFLSLNCNALSCAGIGFGGRRCVNLTSQIFVLPLCFSCQLCAVFRQMLCVLFWVSANFWACVPSSGSINNLSLFAAGMAWRNPTNPATVNLAAVAWSSCPQLCLTCYCHTRSYGQYSAANRLAVRVL